jgi:hypothetical protein
MARCPFAKWRPITGGVGSYRILVKVLDEFNLIEEESVGCP